MEKLSAQGIHSEEMVTFRINNQDIIAAAITKDVLNVVRAAAVQAAMQVSHESTTLLPELKEGMQKIQEPGSNPHYPDPDHNPDLTLTVLLTRTLNLTLTLILTLTLMLP